jgi:hypothetical protein
MEKGEAMDEALKREKDMTFRGRMRTDREVSSDCFDAVVVDLASSSSWS